MARVNAHILDSGDTFPDLEMDSVDHGRIQLPEHFSGGWGVLLVYRAHW
jgi:alkyl hydroperoxide reductase subunit AhpC